MRKKEYNRKKWFVKMSVSLIISLVCVMLSGGCAGQTDKTGTVSYTHLTLPTKA